ncbi:MAG: hypothetical protein V1678_01900 [Candidatus Aenigmatarchaeota archaeon]
MNKIDVTSLSTATPYPGTQMWSDYLKMYNITDINNINWDDFCHGKNIFFVSDDRKKEFERIWKSLNAELMLKNYSNQRMRMIKRAINKPSYSARLLMSYIIQKMKNYKTKKYKC